MTCSPTLGEFWEAIVKNGVASHKRLIAEYRGFAAVQTGYLKDVFLQAADEEAKRAAPIAETKAQAAAYKQPMDEHGMPRDRKPRPSKDFAKEANESDVFGPRYKSYSKVLHRTALLLRELQWQRWERALPVQRSFEKFQSPRGCARCFRPHVTSNSRIPAFRTTSINSLISEIVMSDIPVWQ
jgi:hypothetical protein